MTATVEARANWATPDARLVLTADVGPQDPAWHAERAKGIGGSDVVGVLGLSRWTSPYAVWLDKTGQAEPIEDNPAMRWGRVVEPVLADWFVAETGIAVRRAGLMVHREHDWARVNVDRLTADGGGLEIKRHSWRMAEEWEDDQVSDAAELQAQWGMAVTGRSHWWVIAKVGDEAPLIRRVERDQELIDTLLAEIGRWWHAYVIPREAPPLTASALPAIKARYATADPEQVLDAMPYREHLEELLAAWEQAKADAKAAAAAVDLAEARLRELVADAIEVRDGGPEGPLVLSCRPTGTFAARKFTADEPELAAQYAATKTVVDTDRLKTERPEIYTRYRSRVLRAHKQKES